MTTEQARLDREGIWDAKCMAPVQRTVPRDCVFVHRDSDFTLALIGDSHTSHLFPAFQKAANVRGWRIVTFVKASCPFVDIRIWVTLLEREYPECLEWNENVVKRLRQLRPDLTVTIPFRWIHTMEDRYDSAKQQGRSIGRMLARVPGPKVVIVDTPFSWRDIPDCLDRRPDDPGACAIASSSRTAGGVVVRERMAAKIGGARLVDLTPRFCPTWPCPVITDDDVIKFRDDHHLTATFAKSLAYPVGKALDRALVAQ
jgi:hypothetical protein